MIKGLIFIEKSVDGGEKSITMRMYKELYRSLEGENKMQLTHYHVHTNAIQR
jgi:hypothetical protein